MIEPKKEKKETPVAVIVAAIMVLLCGGAAGLWIENGEAAFPVAEITIAGNLKQMLMDIAYVGNDLEFRGSVNSPTLVIGEMTISGQ